MSEDGEKAVKLKTDKMPQGKTSQKKRKPLKM